MASGVSNFLRFQGEFWDRLIKLSMTTLGGKVVKKVFVSMPGSTLVFHQTHVDEGFQFDPGSACSETCLWQMAWLRCKENPFLPGSSALALNWQRLHQPWVQPCWCIVWVDQRLLFAKRNGRSLSHRSWSPGKRQGKSPKRSLPLSLASLDYKSQFISTKFVLEPCKATSFDVTPLAVDK